MRGENLTIVLGAGGFAIELTQWLADARRRPPDFIVVDDDHVAAAKKRHNDPAYWSRIVPLSEAIARLGGEYMPQAWVAVGSTQTRARFGLLVEESSWQTPVALHHPHATVRGELAAGAIICPGVRVCPRSRVGRNVLLNLNVTLGHESTVGDDSVVCPGVHISGNVTIGDRVFIGSGAVIGEGVTIGDDVTIGAGAVVLKDLPDRVKAWGIPAAVQNA